MSKPLYATLAAALILIGIMSVGPADNTVKKFSSYEELKSFVKSASPGGGFYGSFGSGTFATQTVQVRESAVAEKVTDYSKTNIQVAGVDEADIVKTDGRYIYAVTGNKVVIIDAYPPEGARVLSEINLEQAPSEIFVNKDKLIVFGNGYAKPTTAAGVARPEIYQRYSPETLVLIYDVSNREKPALVSDITADGSYFDSRMIGDYVYVVTNHPVYSTESVPLPAIRSNGKITETPATEIYYFDVPDSSYSFTNILSINTQNKDEPESKTYLMGQSHNMYASTDNIYVVYTKRIDDIRIMERIVDEVLMPLMPSDVVAKIKTIKASDDTRYEKQTKIVSVISEWARNLSAAEQVNLEKEAQENMARVLLDIEKETERTVIHKISIDNGKIEYQTNGEVPGHVLNQFSMDEHNGYFRIATTTNPTGSWGGGFATQTVSAQAMGQEIVVTPQPVAPPMSTSKNHVYVLDSALNIVGKLEDLAPGERIYSARFVGDKAYLVTFRQIDPLFVIDLKEPTSPKVLGFLKIPGVSDYLHPYDENHIIGIGRDATENGRITGMKLSLFDVSDVANPKEISKYIIGKRGTDSEALRDHKAFLFSREKKLLVIPVRLAENKDYYTTWQGAFVFGIDLDNGFALKGRVSHNEMDNGYYDYQSQIRRSLYIDDILYTISGKTVKMNNLEDMKDLGTVSLNVSSNGIIYPTKGEVLIR